MATTGILSSARALVLAGAPVPRTSGAHGLDKTLFLDINGFARHTGWLHTALYDYATYGLVLFVLLLLAGWWAARRTGPAAMAAALWAGVGTVIAVGLAQPVNHAAAEARPWESLPHALILAGHSTDFAFPSDHAVMAGAVTAGLLLYHRRLALVAAVAGLVLCFARVYIGAHYPQDVAAGFLLGAAVVLAGYLVVRVPLRIVVEWLGRTPLRPLVTAQAAQPESAGQQDRQPGTAPAPAPNLGTWARSGSAPPRGPTER